MRVEVPIHDSRDPIVRRDLGANDAAEIWPQIDTRTDGRGRGPDAELLPLKIIPGNNYEPTKLDFVFQGELPAICRLLWPLEPRHVRTLSGAKPGGGTIFVQFRSDMNRWRRHTGQDFDTTKLQVTKLAWFDS